MSQARSLGSFPGPQLGEVAPHDCVLSTGDSSSSVASQPCSAQSLLPY